MKNRKMMEPQNFKYFAFISYSSKDTEWGKRLQRKLEHYRMPATLCHEHGWKRRPINPVFFAPTDIQPGGLTEELQERLRASRNLIVICSPNSARSEWVGKEIEFFHQLGRTRQIHFFIVDGQPHSGDSETECLNPIIDSLGLPEILGANIHERIYRWPWMNKERAYVQLVSKLLGIEFDAIWQRHKRLLVQKIATWTVGLVAIVATLIGMWITNQPVDVEMRLSEASEHNDCLPPLSNAVVTLTLDNEAKTDTIHTLSGNVTFANIPHRYLNKDVRVQVVCADFLPIDTTIVLSNQVVVPIRRDENVYGRVRMQLWKLSTETFVEGVRLTIDGQSSVTDKNGYAEFFVPLRRQKTAYPVQSSVELVCDSVIPVPEDCSIPTLLVQ